jgi:dolichol-phosphate mannosyltransferase
VDGLTITVVIPTYNERDNLPRVVEKLLALGIGSLDVLVVDDNSPDGTGDVADELRHRLGDQVDVLHRQSKDGLGRAYVAGMLQALAAGADVVIQMDADLSHPVEAIPEMIRLLSETDAALVVGSRYVSGGSLDAEWPLRRRLLSRWANEYVSSVLRLGLHDTTAGFKAWRAETLRQIDLGAVTSNGYCFQIETAYRVNRCGLSTAEIPIHFAQRTSGSSKMSLRVQFEAAVVPWQLRSSAWTPTAQSTYAHSQRAVR